MFTTGWLSPHPKRVTYQLPALPHMPYLPHELSYDTEAERVIREKLLLREAQLSQAQRMAGMASWEWYFGDTIVRWSPEMYLFWGYEPNEITVDLDSVAQSTHLDDLPILQGAIGRALQGEDVEMEYRRYDKSGREIFIHTIGRVMRNEAGDPIGVFGIDLNITKRKEHEIHLRQLNEALEQKNRELEQRNAELSAFSYVASHDLQEPLRKIQSFNSLILKTESAALSEQGQDYFRRSMAAAERMRQLIKDLIDYSRVHKTAAEYEQVDLHELLHQIKDDLAEPIREKNATIRTSNFPSVLVNGLMFKQLLQNLISNALNYHKPGIPPSIQLTYKQLEPGIGNTDCVKPTHQLQVADNGIGFDPAFSQRIFGLFQRLHGRDQFGGGTGIGLAICDRIMQVHKGTIFADGKPGEGAVFTVQWPV
ncbi:MAG: PAS domain S-box protein [Cytophagales bacterium]|nr:MAG: PAS domain S-box protein [Cytophagales bacterium]